MAVSRDQAARVLRQEAVSETTLGRSGGEVAAEKCGVLAEQLRSHVAEETRRRTGEAPESRRPTQPALDAPAPGAPAAPTNPRQAQIRA